MKKGDIISIPGGGKLQVVRVWRGNFEAIPFYEEDASHESKSRTKERKKKHMKKYLAEKRLK